MSDLQKFCDELRAKVSIVDVVGDKVKLIRKGREFSGLCPFHNEKTPSFTVNEVKGFYHCFGCGAHGDIIKFEMDANNLPFIDAVQKLADKSGLQMPKWERENSEELEKKASFYDIMELALKFFEKNLRLKSDALNYLYARGFDDGIISKFRLGYSPANNGLRAFLQSNNISDFDMGEVGLVSLAANNTSKRTFDFFRDRVMIPIFDKRGRCIAFGGRVMGKGEPKYLNSPETPIFNKRRILYNYNLAKDKGYEQKSLIICEGYMDVIALDKYGFYNAVAPLGTALTEEQIQEAWKIAPEPILCFDGDNAGIRAGMRSADRVLPILKAGYSLKFAFLPDKLDPDDFLKEKGHDEFEKVLQNSTPLKDILWKKNTEGKETDTPEQKAFVEKCLFDDVSKITDETLKGYYQQEIKRLTREHFNLFAKKPANQTPWEKNTDWKKNKSWDKDKPWENKLRAPIIRPKTNLDELVARFVVSAFVCYPNLALEYEEKLYNFEIKNSKLKEILENIMELAQDEAYNDYDKMLQALDQKGLSTHVNELLEFKMIKIQNNDELKMRENIDLRIIESQIRYLEADIRESLRKMGTVKTFAEDEYNKYISLKKELEALLNAQNIN